jgi:hypothetical protein
MLRWPPRAAPCTHGPPTARRGISEYSAPALGHDRKTEASAGAQVSSPAETDEEAQAARNQKSNGRGAGLDGSVPIDRPPMMDRMAVTASKCAGAFRFR